MVSVLDLIRDARAGRPPEPRTVSFTVDDGYADFAEVGAPIFARYDCPVTVFLITGFVDGGHWMWWDRVRFATEQTRVAKGQLQLGASIIDFALESLNDRTELAHSIIARLKVLPEAERESTQRGIETRLEVGFAPSPPVEFGPMSWEQVRALSANGVSFGPHSVSHPILARTDDARSRLEITDSWSRLAQAIETPVPVFCWPNGDATSFGPREQRVAEQIGMLGAVSTRPASFEPASLATGRAYALPRYAYPSSHEDFVQLASGLERLKDAVRRRVSGP